MNTKSLNRRLQGMTLLEVVVVLAILAILLAMLLPALRRARQGGGPTCVNNLKQIGTAFQIWKNDNANAFPMEVSTNSGGSKEYASGSEVYRHFQAMQNEMGQSPRVILCPKDKDRFAATNFINIDNSNLSYFIGVTVSATSANTNLFLCGDRNLTNGIAPHQGRLWLATNDSCGWTSGLHSDEQNTAGNILFSDGRANHFFTPELQQALKKPGVAPTVIAVP